MEKILPNELHTLLLDIGKQFHEICVRNNIQYWMLGGTQLGAVRYGGFIPWDDDMDFGVLDEDWERLVEALNKELPDIYRCRTRVNYTDMISNTLKIEDVRTLINPTNNSQKVEENIGVNIDIFPLVYTNGRKDVFSRNWFIARLITIQYWRFYDYSNMGFTSLLSNLVKLFGFWLQRNDITRFINRFMLPSKGNYIANFWGSWTLKEIIHKDVFGSPKLQKFEDTEFYGVSDVHAYLEHLYNDYMSLPPADKRHLHIINMYWK